MLETDIKKLKLQVSILDSHIQKTKVWCDNMGKWTTNILNARVTTASDEFYIAANESNNSVNSNSSSSNTETVLLFEIQVQLHEEETFDKENDENSKSLETVSFKEGWVIYRSMKQFESLYQSLCEIGSTEIHNIFKKIPKKISKNIDEEKLKKINSTLDHYLRVSNLKF